MNFRRRTTRIPDARHDWPRKNTMTDPSEMPPESESGASELPTVPVDDRTAAVLEAMDRIQNRRPSWMRAVVLFVISLVLFVGSAGAFVDSVRFLGVLISILFVHELGHYLAMRWFGYRNLRMFFIPFFGAAVSGENYNVAGWKKVVVSLLGPLPGIAIGVALGVIAVNLKQTAGAEDVAQLLLEIGTVSVVINGFNLLPILPLDGGWVMHALIFCRHPVFDAGFRLLAALSMLALGVAMNAWFFLFIGLFLMLGIPITYRMAKLAQRLRHEGVPSEADPNGGIPSFTATKIIDGVDEATGHSASTQIVATHSLQVFETINATPPGILASALFLGVHIASLAVSVLLGFVLMIEKQSSFEDFYHLAMSAPKYSYLCGTLETWSSPDWGPAESDETLLLITHRGTVELASQEFQTLSASPPAAGQLTRFGQSLLVDVKDRKAHDQWKKQLEVNGAVLPSGPVTVRVHCSLPSVRWAQHAKQDCEDYNNWLAGSDWSVPPWSHPENLTKAGLEQMRIARRAYQKVRQKELDLGLETDDGESSGISVTELTEEQIGKLLQLTREVRLDNLRSAVAEVRRMVSSPVENQVLDLMLENEMSMPTGLKEPVPPAGLAQLLGQFVTDENGAVPSGDVATRCRSTKAQQEAFLLAIEVKGFESTTAGLKRLSHWLCRQQTTLIQYDLTTKPHP